MTLEYWTVVLFVLLVMMSILTFGKPTNQPLDNFGQPESFKSEPLYNYSLTNGWQRVGKYYYGNYGTIRWRARIPRESTE